MSQQNTSSMQQRTFADGKFITEGQILGSGSFGVVVKGKQVEDNITVAIKIINKTLLYEKVPTKARGALDREVSSLKQMVGKKNVINLLWVEESRTELVLVFEHCHTTLSSHIEQLSIKYPKRKRQQRIRSNNSRKRVTVRYPLIEENEIRFWMRQLMNGLLLLQEECVVHRDIKPANLMLRLKADDDEITPTSKTFKKIHHFSEFELCIADLGCARFLEYGTLTDTLCGTRPYMAPEVLEGKHGYPCDMYSSGLVMFEMIAGEPAINLTNFNLPFNINAVLKERNFIISDQCIDLLTKLLVRNPDERITVKEAIDHPFFTVTNLVDSLNVSLDNIAIAAANQPEPQTEEVFESEITVEELKQSISDRQHVSIPTIIVLEEDGEFIDITLDKQYDAPFLLKDETLEVEHTVQPSKEVVILVSNEENFEAKTVFVEVQFDGKKENTSISSGGIAQFVFYDVTRETDVNITLSSTLLQRWLYKTVRVHIQIYTHAQ